MKATLARPAGIFGDNPQNRVIFPGMRLLDTLWTFGGHEPLAMYRREGGKRAGGIEGNGLWVEQWHNWFDSRECTELMQELGFNALHCRFYKGMGWEAEKADFPAVKQFVANCRAGGIKVLGYVQFGSLYHEVMRREIPELESWASHDENGALNHYCGDPRAYWRWQPCINNGDFIKYLQRICAIGLAEGGFDGIFFDNLLTLPCYCSRCRKLFVDYLKRTRPAEVESRFGLPFFDYVQPPPMGVYDAAEIKDAVAQEWLRFRLASAANTFAALYAHIKGVRPDAVVAGNFGNIRRRSIFSHYTLHPAMMKDCFDIIISQSGNAFGSDREGYIVNRQREMKLGDALGRQVFALADGDGGNCAAAGVYEGDLYESLVSGSIAHDRHVICPQRGGALRRALITERKPILLNLKKVVARHRDLFEAPRYAPLGILYAHASQMFSRNAAHAVMSAEEIALRHRIPYRLVLSGPECGLQNMDDCRILLAPGQSCLCDREVAELKEFARKGGRLLLTQTTGDCDENNRQRAANPFGDISHLENVTTFAEFEHRIAADEWTLRIGLPGNYAQPLAAIEKNISLPMRFSAPGTLFADFRIMPGGTCAAHLINYAAGPCAGIIARPADADVSYEFITPANFERPLRLAVKDGRMQLPPVQGWAALRPVTE